MNEIKHKGIKTPLMIGVAIWIFFNYNLDIVAKITSIFNETDYKPLTEGMILSAVFLAGGSSSINKVLEMWKIRDLPARQAEIAHQNLMKTNPDLAKLNEINEISLQLKDQLENFTDANHSKTDSVKLITEINNYLK